MQSQNLVVGQGITISDQVDRSEKALLLGESGGQMWKQQVV